MGKVRQQRHREDLDESNSSLRLNRSVNVASTSAFNVFRGFSNPLKRTSPGLNTAVRGEFYAILPYLCHCM